MRVPTYRELRAFVRLHLLRRAYDHPARDEDLGVVSLGYEPEAFEAQLQAFEGRFTVREAAAVTYGGARRAIFDVRSTNFATASRRLLVLSGVHGNEQAGIVCVPEILERFHRESARFEGLGLCVLTPVNPVGAAEGSRFNGDGYDINRDFQRFDTVEARLVRAVFDEMRPDFVLSLHEGPQDASFVFANEHVRGTLAERVLDAIESQGTALATRDYFGATLRRRGLSPSTRVTRAITRAWAASLGMMASIGYSERRGVPELTLESSWRSDDRAARVRAHVDLTLALCEALDAG